MAKETAALKVVSVDRNTATDTAGNVTALNTPCWARVWPRRNDGTTIAKIVTKFPKFKATLDHDALVAGNIASLRLWVDDPTQINQGDTIFGEFDVSVEPDCHNKREGEVVPDGVPTFPGRGGATLVQNCSDTVGADGLRTLVLVDGKPQPRFRMNVHPQGKDKTFRSKYVPTHDRMATVEL